MGAFPNSPTPVTIPLWMVSLNGLVMVLPKGEVLIIVEFYLVFCNVSAMVLPNLSVLAVFSSLFFSPVAPAWAVVLAILCIRLTLPVCMNMLVTTLLAFASRVKMLPFVFSIMSPPAFWVVLILVSVIIVFVGCLLTIRLSSPVLPVLLVMFRDLLVS